VHMEGAFCSSWDMNSMYDHLIKCLCHSRWRLDIKERSYLWSLDINSSCSPKKEAIHGATCDLAKSNCNNQESFESYLMMPSPILQPGKGSWFKTVCTVLIAS
jgi:hypothetical protein